MDFTDLDSRVSPGGTVRYYDADSWIGLSKVDVALYFDPDLNRKDLTALSRSVAARLRDTFEV